MLLLTLLGCGGPADTGQISDAPGDDTAISETGETGAPVEYADAALVEGGVVTCADPALRESLGPMARYEGDEIWSNQYIPAPIEGIPAVRGAAVADWTGDGVPDVLLTNVGLDQMFVSDGGGGWREETAERWHGEDQYSASATPLDVDDDGDLDLVISNRGGRNRLYLNDGAGAFSEGEAGFLDEAWGSTGAVAGDLNGDGIVDLLFGAHSVALEDVWVNGQHSGNPGDPGELYLGDGEGGFVDASEVLSDEVRQGYTFVAGLIDMDLDGDLDPYLVNDFGRDWTPNALLRNDGELAFTDVAWERGAQVAICGMGLGVGDVNGDRYPDLAISGWSEMALLESFGDGTWVDTTAARGVDPGEGQHVAWGLELVDMDNDGALDLPIQYGFLGAADTEEDNPREQPDALLLRGEDGAYVDVADAWGIADAGVGRGFAAIDMNRDGFLDLLKLQMGQGAVLYLSRCDDSAWLSVELDQPAPNVDAIGARIELTAPDGRTWTEWIHVGGTNLGVATGPEAHFGLGDAERVDVEVVWPDGERSRIEAVTTRQAIRIERL